MKTMIKIAYVTQVNTEDKILTSTNREVVFYCLVIHRNIWSNCTLIKELIQEKKEMGIKEEKEYCQKGSEIRKGEINE